MAKGERAGEGGLTLDSALQALYSSSPDRYSVLLPTNPPRIKADGLCTSKRVRWQAGRPGRMVGQEGAVDSGRLLPALLGVGGKLVSRGLGWLAAI